MRTGGPRGAFFLTVISLCLGLAAAPASGARSGADLPSSGLEKVYATVGGLTGDLPAEAAGLPVVKRDPQGRVWAAWEKWEAGRGRVGYALFGDAGVRSAATVGTAEGSDISPDLAFSATGSPWITWVNVTGDATEVLVRDLALGRTWSLTAESAAAAAGPKILFDAGGAPWVFWSLASGRTGEIVYRTLRDDQWTEAARVPRGTGRPALSPAAAVDSRGVIWLAWSGYDGEDYGIYLSSLAGGNWTRPARVSANPGPNASPSLGFDADGHPVVVWTRPADGSHQVCLSSWTSGTPAAEVCLDSQTERPVASRIVEASGGAAVALKSDGRLRFVPLPATPATGTARTLASPPAPRLPNALALDENKYAGFGDSITFGYVDWYSHPDRGYIPRLNTILNTAYGGQRVINEGFGGEVTGEGLARIGKVFIADLNRYILIMEGTNDVVFTEISMPSAAFNLQEMVRKSLAAGVFPAIATIVPRYDWFGGQALYRDRLLSLNARIRQIAVDMAVPLVDMYTAFMNYPAGSGGVLSLLSTDLKHPSDKGYQFMAETWFAGIRAFPFPPAGLEVEAVGREKTVRERPLQHPVSRTAARLAPAADARQAFGNRLTWTHSPKVFDPSGVLGYRIYRKASAGAAAPFQLLAFVGSPLEYFDRGLTVIGRYDYALATVRRDGIEGPLSDAVR